MVAMGVNELMLILSLMVAMEINELILILSLAVAMEVVTIANQSIYGDNQRTTY